MTYRGRETVFDDRHDAGRALGKKLTEIGVEADVVLAIPRGGLPLGREVADALNAPLDIVVASKIGAPGRPELAIGAVASDGTVWIDERSVKSQDVTEEYLET